ncbi:hypothetical protein LJB88_01335 [Erysipelotrichaceae bacterium OttesenSCG-928-M19]|nr:hypothetical protein [Erysipelotrichaceae bacterium OttesenSCG-928-M19]
MEEIYKLIDERKYDEALKKLLVLPDNYLLKAQCLYELERYNELVSFFEQINEMIENDYFEVLGYYILALIKLEDYDKALNMINDELAMPYVQEDYYEVLNNLYDDVLAQKQAFLVDNNAYDIRLDDETIEHILLDHDNYDEQLDVIMRLEDYNIRKLLPIIETFLVNDNSLVLKTFILELLVKQQINEAVLVNKNGFEYEFLPNANLLVFQDLNYLKIRDLLEVHLAKQPSFLEMCYDILDLVVYIIYPEIISEDETYLAALIEYYVFSLNSEELMTDFTRYYQIDLSFVESNLSELINILESEEKYGSLI